MPRRTVVLRLAAALGLSSAETDRLLLGAGYAPPWLVELAGAGQVLPLPEARHA